MHGYRKTSLSDSSDEDLLSTLVEKDGTGDLYACEVIPCEFCDEAFLNRYNYLVHNANHIIIPLLRRTYFKCEECQLQCRTNGKLQKHMKKLHPYITKSHHNNNTFRDSAESQIVNNNNDNSNREYNNECNMKTSSNEHDKETFSTLEKEVPVTKPSNLDIEIIEIESDDDTEFAVKEELNHNNSAEKMRNRLVFEEDEEDIIKSFGLIDDLTADIQVSVPLEPWMISIADKNKNVYPKTNLESINTQMEEKWRSMTVSYQDLMEMETVTCKYCKVTFQNRLSLIKHESTHIASKRRYPFLCQYCDWYVASDPHTLHKHYVRSHPDRDTMPVHNVLRKTCPVCKLKYISQLKHFKNYHGTELEYKTHDQEENTDIPKPIFVKKIKKICDLCLSFLKNIPNNVYYKFVREESISGERQTCGRCLKQCFSINLVELTSRHRFVGPRKPKSISNVDRLKNFKNRLKMLKK